MRHRLVTIREHGQLTTEPVQSSLDLAQVSGSAFDWLCRVSSSFSRSGARLLDVEGRRTLVWGSYVGVIETPCGTRLEILPKHFEAGDCVRESRDLLCRMIQSALDLKPRQVTVTGLRLFDAPLSEWVFGQFLSELELLVKRGLRFDYQRVEEEQRFLRGQLNVVAQMRQPPGRQQHFQIRHDVFLPDRPENRLLKLALEQVSKSTRDGGNWRLAGELRTRLEGIASSDQVKADLRAWSHDRLMSRYRAVKPWCELILMQEMPLAVVGEWQGLSLLFPMERLFERHVETWLRRHLHAGARLTPQAASLHLCTHDGGAIFRLEPDIFIQQGSHRWVLDTKWKRLNQHDRKSNYQLSQVDFYQLYAYGQKYLDGRGELALIYPRWAKFMRPLPVFEFGGGLRLWALPFDLEQDLLLGIERPSLPVGSPPIQLQQRVAV